MKIPFGKIRIRGRLIGPVLGMLIGFVAPSGAQSVTVVPIATWNPSPTHSGSAGEDLDNPIQCSLGDYELNVHSGSYGTSWHVAVRMSQPNGDPGFKLEVLRDASQWKISGGTDWVTVGTADTYFFSANGFKNVNGIGLQYRISNITAGDPGTNAGAGTFSLTVTYTIQPGL
jgi:hypothetical protein